MASHNFCWGMDFLAGRQRTIWGSGQRCLRYYAYRKVIAVKIMLVSFLSRKAQIWGKLLPGHAATCLAKNPTHLNEAWGSSGSAKRLMRKRLCVKNSFPVESLVTSINGKPDSSSQGVITSEMSRYDLLPITCTTSGLQIIVDLSGKSDIR